MSFEPVSVLLLCDSDAVRAAVRLCVTPPNRIVEAHLDDLLTDANTFTDEGQRIVRTAAGCDAIMVAWGIERAPLIGTLAHAVRRKADIPVIALCGASQEEQVAALASGVDEVLVPPFFLPLLQARLGAHRRLVRQVRKAAARRARKRLKKKQRGLVTAAEAMVEDQAKELGDVLAGLEGAALDERIEQVIGHIVTEAVEDAVEDAVEELSAVVDDLPGAATASTPAGLTVGPLRLDADAMRFFVDESEVEMTPKEFALMRFLMEHAGRACSRDQILDGVWGINFDTGTNMVDVYMHFVRKKLAAHGHKGLITTIRGHGYRLSPSEQPGPAAQEPT